MAMAEKMIGKSLGDFRIEELIGRGSFGKVYRAIQTGLNRECAVKVLEEGIFTLDEVKERFQREAEFIARLEHPNIVPVYAAGQEGNYLYFAMRLIRGKTLGALKEEGTRLRNVANTNPQTTARISIPIADPVRRGPRLSSMRSIPNARNHVLPSMRAFSAEHSG